MENSGNQQAVCMQVCDTIVGLSGWQLKQQSGCFANSCVGDSSIGNSKVAAIGKTKLCAQFSQQKAKLSFILSYISFDHTMYIFLYMP